MNWAQQQRQHFITARLLETGRINRRDLEAWFQVSTMTASTDLRTYRTKGAFAIAYDKSAKAYVLAIAP